MKAKLITMKANFRQFDQQKDWPYHWRWQCLKCKRFFYVGCMEIPAKVHKCNKKVLNLRKDST